MTISLIFLLSFPLINGCKARNESIGSGSSVKGVISQSPPGGTLAKRELATFDCKDFQEAVWYRMSKPVGAFIWHQYLGVRMTFKHESEVINEFETSGLSDPSDLGNFRSWWYEKGESNKYAHMISSKKYTNCQSFLASARRVNAAMASSRYQNVGIRVISMVIAPVPVLGGRPCARQAASGTQVWLTNEDNDRNEPEYCDDCTEKIPGAKWSANSVDWDDTAFTDAAAEASK